MSIRMNLILDYDRDPDLLAAYRYYGKALNERVIQAVTAYVNDKPYQIDISEKVDIEAGKNVSMTLSFHNDNAFVVGYLNQFKAGCRQEIIKRILRNYLTVTEDNWYKEVIHEGVMTIPLSLKLDSDLAVLCGQGRKKFERNVKKCLMAFCEGTEFHYTLPKAKEIKGVYEKEFSIVLEKEDKKLIEFLNSLKDNMRYSVIKTIFRRSFGKLFISGIELKSAETSKENEKQLLLNRKKRQKEKEDLVRIMEQSKHVLTNAVVWTGANKEEDASEKIEVAEEKRIFTSIEKEDVPEKDNTVVATEEANVEYAIDDRNVPVTETDDMKEAADTNDIAMSMKTAEEAVSVNERKKPSVGARYMPEPETKTDTVYQQPVLTGGTSVASGNADEEDEEEDDLFSGLMR